MSYDKKCWRLAKDFLDDEHDLNIDKRDTHELAQTIQDAIEEWIANRRIAKKATPPPPSGG